MKKHPMKVVEGIPGVTTVTVYEYREHKITQRFRSYDSRNKTHNGYDWSTDFGQPIGNTRKRAKELIDRHVDQPKPEPPRMVELPYEIARDMILSLSSNGSMLVESVGRGRLHEEMRRQHSNAVALLRYVS